MSDAVYSTKVSATGGRHGSIRSNDGLFNLKLALPRTLGGKGDATNPERLFAGGYASSFQNALFHVSREARRHFADCDIEVVAQIGLMERPYKGITGVHGREDSRPRGRRARLRRNHHGDRKNPCWHHWGKCALRLGEHCSHSGLARAS